jgi:hypothetical protein
MAGYSTTDLGLLNARLRALKRRGVAGAVPIPESAATTPTLIEAGEVVRLTGSVAKSDANGATSDKRITPLASPANEEGPPRTTKPAAGTRSHERRWRDASIILVERRRGDLYRYGSIALCAALWAQVWWMFRT